MSPAAAWVLVGLVALLVIAAIPVLLQLRRTLLAAEETLRSTGDRVNATLDRVTVTLDRVNGLADDLEKGVGRISNLFDSLGAMGDTLMKVRMSMRAVVSVGSAVGAAILGAFGIRPRDRGEEDDPDGVEPQMNEEAAR